MIHLLALLKIWESLRKKLLKERVGKSKFEEWSKHVVNEMRKVFRSWVIDHLEEKLLDREK